MDKTLSCYEPNWAVVGDIYVYSFVYKPVIWYFIASPRICQQRPMSFGWKGAKRDSVEPQWCESGVHYDSLHE